MDTAQLTSQWQAFKEYRQELVEQISELKRKLNNPSTEPELEQLFEEKGQLIKIYKELQLEINSHKDMIKGMKLFLQARKLVVNDRYSQKKCNYLLKARKEYMISLKKMNANKERIERQERYIWELKAPITELEKVFNQEIADYENRIQKAETISQKASLHIAVIEDRYLQTKKCLEDIILERENSQRQCKVDEIEWATRDREHLKFMLLCEPSYANANDLVRRYQERFPGENLSDILAKPTSVSVLTQNGSATGISKKRHSCYNLSLTATAAAECISSENQPWNIWITFDLKDQDQKLPNDPKQMLTAIQLAMDKSGYFYQNIGAHAIRNKIIAVMKKTVQQRQQMEKVKPYGPVSTGWKKEKVAKHRLFFKIDETTRCMKVFLGPRRKLYGHH